MDSRIVASFFYALILTVVLPSLFTHLHLLYFAPFLILIYYKKSKFASLWFSLLSGLIIDLLSSQTRLGVYALNYCITTWILFPQKKHFFEDSFSTLPILTFLFSIISTLTQISLLNVFGPKVTFSWELIKNDLIWMPAIDALYALVAFTIPSFFIPKKAPRRSLLFSPKKGFS